MLGSLAAFLGLLVVEPSQGQVAPEEFFQRDFVDAYDEIRQKMESVTEENCGIKVRFTEKCGETFLSIGPKICQKIHEFAQRENPRKSNL